MMGGFGKSRQNTMVIWRPKKVIWVVIFDLDG